MPESTTFAYPKGGWRRRLFRTPLYLWRLGAGPLLRGKMLILSTRGRRSGLVRHTALEYSVINGFHYLGSGWGMRPDWCQNLAADPHATVQSRSEEHTSELQSLRHLV